MSCPRRAGLQINRRGPAGSAERRISASARRAPGQRDHRKSGGDICGRKPDSSLLESKTETRPLKAFLFVFLILFLFSRGEENRNRQSALSLGVRRLLLKR